MNENFLTSNDPIIKMSDFKRIIVGNIVFQIMISAVLLLNFKILAMTIFALYIAVIALSILFNAIRQNLRRVKAYVLSIIISVFIGVIAFALNYLIYS